MLDIAANINCKLIGEGIEVRQEYLTADACEMKFAQGYYFGRPSRYPQHKLDAALFSERKKMQLATGRARIDTLVISLLTELFPLHEDDNFHTAAERFQRNLDLPAIPVINHEHKVVGMIWRDEFMTLYASRYGRELHGRKTIRHFSDNDPIVVETTLPLKNLSYRITSQETKLQRSMFIITEEGRYRGVGNLMDLLRRITDMQITSARHANPLSNLPGNVPISEQTRDAIEQDRDVTICYVDLDNFKPYNDIYGYSKGDNVISHTAKLLANHIDHDIDFLGHVGGDDFVILFESEDWQSRCEKILADFTLLRTQFYSEKHIKQGGIKALDRNGNQAFYSLLSLSIGAVRMKDFDELSNEGQLVECATSAKSLAKKKRGNSLHLISKNEGCSCNNMNRNDALLEVVAY
jgi:diguanylate cyclase (GGDEF)-like protein